MSRLTLLGVAAGVVSLVAARAPAFAQSQAAIAEKANDEGKKLMFAKKFDEAAEQFKNAAQRTNEPKYFFNLCTAYYQGGRFPEANTACKNVKNSNPSAEQSQKADTLLAKITEQATAQNISLDGGGGGGGDPTGPDGTDPTGTDPTHEPTTTTDPTTGVVTTNPPTGNPTGPSAVKPVVGAKPTESLFEATKPDNRYTWTLGAELFGGAGTIGSNQRFGTTSAGFRLKGDYLLNEAHRFGAQGYLQYTSFTQGANAQSGASPLTIVDVGAALYKDLCPPAAERLCLTPLVGVHLALMNPDDQMADGTQTFNYTAVGGRAELGAHIALGHRNEHVISVALGANAYTKALSTPNDTTSTGGTLTAADVNLDKGGVAAYLSVGYTYRFNTPLGRAAVVTLE